MHAYLGAGLANQRHAFADVGFGVGAGLGFGTVFGGQTANGERGQPPRRLVRLTVNLYFLKKGGK